MLRRETFKWIILTAAALTALRLFYVQEMIAAFLMLSLLSACIAAAVLIVYLLGHAVHTVLELAWEYIRVQGNAAPRRLRRFERLATRRVRDFVRPPARFEPKQPLFVSPGSYQGEFAAEGIAPKSGLNNA